MLDKYELGCPQNRLFIISTLLQISLWHDVKMQVSFGG